MTDVVQLPPAQIPLVDGRGFMTDQWRTFFTQLLSRAGGITGGLQPADATLDALALVGAAPLGFLALTGTDAFAKRTLTGTAGRISVTNGAGGGNPVIDLVPGPFLGGTFAPVNSITVNAYGKVTGVT
jgi:hypothetical protein